MKGRSFHIGGSLLFVLGVLIGGCGGDEEAGPGAGLARLAPPDAPLFADVALRPAEDQSAAIDAFVGRLGVPEPGAELVAALDGLFADNGLEVTYDDDIEPWLGERGGFFVRSFEPSNVLLGVPEFAAMLEVSDPDAANAFIDDLQTEDPTIEEDRTYGGYEYAFGGSGDSGFAIGVVEEVLVLGTEASFKVAVDAAEGESLAESEEYSDRVAALGGDPVAAVFVEPGTAIEAAIATNDITKEDADVVRPLLAGPLSSPLAAGLSATEAAASVDIVAAVDGVESAISEASLLERLPAESWFALAAPDFGATIERTLDQLETSGLPGADSLRDTVHAETGLDLSLDVTAWLGDVSAFVAGTGEQTVELGFLAETSDPEGPRAALDAGRRLIKRDSPGAPIGPPPEGADYGFSVSIPGAQTSLEAGVVGGEVVAAIGRSAADLLSPPETLGDDEGYRAAAASLGDEFEASAYVDLPSFFTVAELGGAAGDPDYLAAEPYLDALSYLIAGARVEDGLAVSRLTVGLDE